MNFIKILIIFISFGFCQTTSSIDSIVYFQLLLLKSKMDINPICWQDTREGYLRNRTVRFCDLTLDKLGKIETEELVRANYPVLDSLVASINDGQEFKLVETPKRNYQFNYFYSSSSKP
tara:strand:+ start:101 stop:457 length:357 start_codon:yes stop_codon:yes gene_type:complete